MKTFNDLAYNLSEATADTSHADHDIHGGVKSKDGSVIHAVFDKQKRKVGNIKHHPDGTWSHHGYRNKLKFNSAHEAASALRPNKN